MMTGARMITFGIALACAAGAASCSSSSPQPSPSVTRTPVATTTSGGPQSFAVSTVTALSPAVWWVVGTSRCGTGNCAAIEQTTDGGRHFRSIPTPPAGLGEGFSALTFADSHDGFAFGPGLYVTHTDGRRWQHIALDGELQELTTTRHFAYAIVQRGGRHLLERSEVTGGGWRRLPAPRNLYGQLSTDGTDLFAQSRHGSGLGGLLLRSTDGGRRWSSDSLPIPDLPCQFRQVRPPVLWEQCNSGTEASIWHSPDQGRTLTHPAAEGQDQFGNGMVFAAATGTVGVAGTQRLQRTSDGAQSFHDVGPVGFTWTSIDFVDAAHGLAVAHGGQNADEPGELWASGDGGRSWHHVVVPSLSAG